MGIFLRRLIAMYAVMPKKIVTRLLRDARLIRNEDRPARRRLRTVMAEKFKPTRISRNTAKAALRSLPILAMGFASTHTKPLQIPGRFYRRPSQLLRKEPKNCGSQAIESTRVEECYGLRGRNDDCRQNRRSRLGGDCWGTLAHGPGAQIVEHVVDREDANRSERQLNHGPPRRARSRVGGNAVLRSTDLPLQFSAMG